MEKEEVILVAGIINATDTMLYWKVEGIENIEIEDYAIVENKNGYDLVKVIGIITTTKQRASRFSKTRYENMKKVVCLIKEIESEED